MLERLQNRALRIILKDRYAHITEMHNQLNVLMLKTRRKHHLCQQIYKGINHLSPSYISDKLEIIERGEGMTTRSAGQCLRKPKQTKLEICKRNFFYKEPNTRNPLEYEIKHTNSLQLLKCQLYQSTIFDS